MRGGPSNLADVVSRWDDAAAELQQLLEQTDQLMEQRARLRRERSALFRAIVREARLFVDEDDSGER